VLAGSEKRRREASDAADEEDPVQLDAGSARDPARFPALAARGARRAAARARRGDREKFRRLAHKLAGSFALYGFKWAGAQCRALQDASAQGEAADSGAPRERAARASRQVVIQ
jgi:two-component system response regulator BaeR